MPSDTLLTPLSSESNSIGQAVHGLGCRAARICKTLLPEALVLLLVRCGLAGVFWLSARTKVQGCLSVTAGTIDLFRDEYRLPVLPPVFAAYLASYAEHLFAVSLLVGLGTRLSALGIIGMTAVIQLLVYPDAWPTHLSWFALAAVLVRHGAGAWSLDHLLYKRLPK